MDISRRLLLEGVLASAGELVVGRAQGQTSAHSAEIEQQLEDLEPSSSPTSSSPIVTTVGFERLAKDPSLKLDQIRKSLGTIFMFPENENPLWFFLKHFLGMSELFQGTVTYLAEDRVLFDNHEIIPGYKRAVIFSPEPDKYFVTTIDVNPGDQAPSLDLAIGRLGEAGIARKNGLPPVKWRSWEYVIKSRQPLVAAGCKGWRLHATLGKFIGYEDRFEVTQLDKSKKIVTCKERTTNVVFHGESGGLLCCGGNGVGIIANTIYLKEDGLIIGSGSTPADVVANGVSERMPEVAKKAGIYEPLNIRKAIQERLPECAFK